MNLFGWDAHSVTPTTDALLWIRWFVSVVVIWWLPGWLLLRGRLQDWPQVTATYARLATGFVWLVVIGLAMRWLDQGLPPLLFATVSLILAFGLGRWLSRGVATHHAQESAGPAGWWWATVGCAGLFAAMVIGFKDLPAPPHVHDASNHAFMVARAAELGSLDPSRIFAELLPHKVYLSGWHLAAAITGSLAGVAPYIATWFTAITCVALVPIALATLWWRWGVGAAVAVAGTLWVMTNSDTPAGNPFSWGGLGVHVGFFIAPLGAIVLAGAIRSRRPLLAFAAGLYLAATIHMHFSEVVIIPLLAILTVVMQRRQVPVVPVARWWPAAALFGLGLAFAYVPAMVEGAGRYASDIGGIRSNVETVGLMRALRSFPQGIGPPDLRFPWAVGGTILMLSVWRWRPIAVASLILGLWIFALKFWYDPVSRTLATPYYGQVGRIAYQHMYLMPLAAGAATVMLIRFAARRNRWLAGAACVLAATTMVLGYAKHHRNLASLENKIPFDQQEYLLAREIGEFVPDGEAVANYRDDGSTWAWHVSGRDFLNPLSWDCTASDGTDLMGAAHGLRESPWPSAARGLEERGVRWLYVSDHRLEAPRLEVPPLLKPEDFEGDPRFSVALERDGTRLLRINWDLQDE